MSMFLIRARLLISKKQRGMGHVENTGFFFHLMGRISKILFNILLMGQGNTTEIAGFRFIDI